MVRIKCEKNRGRSVRALRRKLRSRPSVYRVTFVGDYMKTFLLWIILLMLCWPLALLALLLYPLVWIIMLPFRLVGITVDALFEFIKALFLLPARVVRGR